VNSCDLPCLAASVNYVLQHLFVLVIVIAVSGSVPIAERQISRTHVDRVNTLDCEDFIKILYGFASFNHRDTCIGFVSRRVVILRCISSACTNDRWSVASFPQRWVLCRCYSSFGFLNRINHRNDDAASAGIKHSSNDSRLVPRHSANRGAVAGQHYCLKHGCGHLIISNTVLHIDAHVVKIDTGDNFSSVGVRQR
ncbi:uncharacterized protein METZ01_LOCUS17004, partial [marine metagenome]